MAAVHRHRAGTAAVAHYAPYEPVPGEQAAAGRRGARPRGVHGDGGRARRAHARAPVRRWKYGDGRRFRARVHARLGQRGAAAGCISASARLYGAHVREAARTAADCRGLRSPAGRWSAGRMRESPCCKARNLAIAIWLDLGYKKTGRGQPGLTSTTATTEEHRHEYATNRHPPHRALPPRPVRSRAEGTVRRGRRQHRTSRDAGLPQGDQRPARNHREGSQVRIDGGTSPWSQCFRTPGHRQCHRPLADDGCHDEGTRTRETRGNLRLRSQGWQDRVGAVLYVAGAQRRDKALRNSALLSSELTVLTTASDRTS